MAPQRLQAGVSEREITPALGAPLIAELSCRPATGVRSPLMVRALILADGEETLAIVTLDLYGLERGAAGRLAEAVGAAVGLRPEALLVVSSHTRGGPCAAGVLGCPEPDGQYLARVVEAAAGAVAEAMEQLQPAALGYGRAVLPHLVYNHRLLTRNMKAISAWLGVPPDEVLAPEGPTDPEFGVLVVRDGHGFPVALLYSLAADNRFAADGNVSADLPGLAQRELDRRLGRHVPALYLPGCGGDVSYVHDLVKSADLVASAVMAVQLETPCDPAIQLGCACERMILPIRDYSRFWARADVELKWPQAVAACERELEMLRQEGARALPAAVQAFRLGRWALVGLAGMPFVDLGLEVKAQSPALATMVAGNAGGHVGTVVTRRAFDGGGYETWPGRSGLVGPGGGEFMAEQAGSLLKRLWRSG